MWFGHLKLLAGNDLVQRVLIERGLDIVGVDGEGGKCFIVLNAIGNVEWAGLFFTPDKDRSMSYVETSWDNTVYFNSYIAAY